MKYKYAMFNFIILLIFISVTSCSSQEEKANKLFVKAATNIQKAKDIESISYELAYGFFLKAQNYKEAILNKYGNTNLAVELVSGKKIINGVKFNQFEEIENNLFEMCEFKSKPLYIAFLVSLQEKDEDILYDLADAYNESGNNELIPQILEEAWNIIKHSKYKIDYEYLYRKYTKYDIVPISEILNVLNDEDRQEMWKEKALYYIDIENYDNALSLINYDIKDEYDKLEILIELFDNMKDKEYINELEEVIDSFDDEYIIAKLKIKLGDLYSKMGYDNFKTAYMEAFALAKSFTYLTNECSAKKRVDILTESAERLRSVNKTNLANEAIRLALDTINYFGYDIIFDSYYRTFEQ